MHQGAMHGGGGTTSRPPQDPTSNIVPTGMVGDDIVIDLTVEPARLIFGTKQLELDEEPISQFHRVTKRAFDVMIAGVLLVMSMPVMFILYLAVRLTSRGPGIYRSPRIGQSGEIFDVLKFRTMVVDADKLLADVLEADPELNTEYASSHKLKSDPRFTPIGSALRRYSLDELPQLINVLAGDMSVVGPRPKLPSEPKRFGVAMPTVLRVKPGMTGLWQVSGRSKLSFDERIMLDVEYAATPSLRADVSILARTALLVCRPEEGGAY